MSAYTDLEGKVVVITGANGDLGLAFCRKFLENNCQVYAMYHNNVADLQELEKEYENTNKGSLHTYQCDITEREQLEGFESYIANGPGKIDVLINNAGINKDTLFSTMTFDDYDLVLKTNLYGTFNTIQLLLRQIRRGKNPSIINISSVSGVTSSFGQVNYSAAKAGIVGMTRTLAVELSQKGIRVNAIAPGMVESKMVKRVPRHLVRQILAAIPLKRLGEPDEIANVASFLASESSSYVLGQTLIVDGGLIMR